MSNEIANIAMKSLTPAQLENMTVDALYRALKSTFELTLSTIETGAAIWQRLEDLGEDMSVYKDGMMKALAQVAHKKLAPRAMLKLPGAQGKQALLSRVSLEFQEKILTEKIEVFRNNRSIWLPIEQLNLNELTLAIDVKNNKINTIVVQRKLATQKKNSENFRPIKLVTVALPIKLYKQLKDQSEIKRLSVERILSAKIESFYGSDE